MIPFSPHDSGAYRVSDTAALDKTQNGYSHTPVSQLIIADLDIVQAYNYAGRVLQEGALFRNYTAISPLALPYELHGT